MQRSTRDAREPSGPDLGSSAAASSGPELAVVQSAGRTATDTGPEAAAPSSMVGLAAAPVQRHSPTTALLGSGDASVGLLTAPARERSLLGRPGTAPRSTAGPLVTGAAAGPDRSTHPADPGAPNLPRSGTPSSASVQRAAGTTGSPSPRTLDRMNTARGPGPAGAALLTTPAPAAPVNPIADAGVIAQRARMTIGSHRPLPPIPQRPAAENAEEPPPPADPGPSPAAVPEQPAQPPAAQPAQPAQPIQPDTAALSPPELDRLAQQLLDPMLRRIRNEFLLDRERRGRRGDWR